jgi:hypothetical protein
MITRLHASACYFPALPYTGDTGWSLVRFRTGNAAPENFHTLEDVLGTLAEES